MSRSVRLLLLSLAWALTTEGCTSSDPPAETADAFITSDASAPSQLEAAASVSPGNAACLPNLTLKDGWLGADAVASIDLGAGKSVWFFGDTFMGSPSQTTRAGTTFVRNSIAISSCNDGGTDVRYLAGPEEKGKPTSFFELPPGSPSFADAGSGDAGTVGPPYLWPLDGFVHQGTLFVTFNVVRNTNSGTAFAFKVVGTTLARIEHPENDPLTWAPTFSDLTTTSDFGLGLTIVRDASFAYFYGPVSAGTLKGSLLLSRISLAALLSHKSGTPLPPLFETLRNDGTWGAGITDVNAKAVYDRPAPEMTIRFHPDTGQYIAVQGEPGYFTRKVVARTSTSMSGPWSVATELFSYPEMASGADKDTFCYASREHIEYNSPTMLAVSYACNSLDFAKVLADQTLYVPKLLFVPFPK